jgi:putative transposase
MPRPTHPYIRMAEGFLYLVAVMDWFSRFVLSWALSLTMELDFCLDALERALPWGRPEIFNSDQGSQFTSEKFTSVLAQRGVASAWMDAGAVWTTSSLSACGNL